MTLVRAVRTVGGGFGEAEKDEDVVEFPRQSLVVAETCTVMVDQDDMNRRSLVL